MKDMELLKEGDMPYFEELEKEGKAVILRIDVDTLLNLDLDDLLSQADTIPTDAQVKAWLEKEDAVVADFIVRTRTQKEHNAALEQSLSKEKQPDAMEMLMEAVRISRLPEADNEIVQKAIMCRFSANEILDLLDDRLETSERQSLFERMFKKHGEIFGG